MIGLYMANEFRIALSSAKAEQTFSQDTCPLLNVEIYIIGIEVCELRDPPRYSRNNRGKGNF